MYAGAAYVVVVIDDAMSTAATAAMEGEIEEGFIIVVCLILRVDDCEARGNDNDKKIFGNHRKQNLSFGGN